MKKALALSFLALFLVASIAMVSATTVVAGKIYNADYSDIISGANVTVTCGTAGDLPATSQSDGSYKVEYSGTVCGDGDTLTVYAEKGSLSGSKTATLKASGDCTKDDNCLINVYDGLDVAVVNVPLIPEFGIFVGALTLLSAVGVFFLVRRK